MGMTGKYPPTGGWDRLIPEKIKPDSTLKNDWKPSKKAAASK